MRLIDADKIPFVNDPKRPHVEGFQTVTKMAIDNMPTIDPQSCDGCKYDDIIGNPKCEFCSRILPDRYKPKEKAE